MIIRVISLLDFICTSSRKEQGLKTQIVENGGISLCMTEWVNIPAYSWGLSKLVFQPAMAFDKVADDVLIISCGFLRSNPASHGDL